MYHLHGYRGCAVAVDTDLVLEHKREEDRAHAMVLLDAAATGDQHFSNYHHIVDVDGNERTVLTVGTSRLEPVGTTTPHRYSRGFMVDVTDDEVRSARLAVERARQHAASIQQSLGLLMGTLGLTEEAAFAVLSRLSQHHNVRVRDLAPRFMAAAASTATRSPRDLTELLTKEATALALERRQQLAPSPSGPRP
ncbi:ANTAR domain-containing protein [Nocardioides sp. CFH 31398]|uniref:ANTAR domain-containing protein n=1 Tax=Nocardioides sp. CFH 31398 TaxID=2919579 RepID=UPI001F06F68E|nr:ANTAR domain-containing protein [Nocardioides sp. CFH 31398]MCH1868796.1 ANTAR domain-containing protein [Nocardioides sp. CFH 31398]